MPVSFPASLPMPTIQATPVKLGTGLKDLLAGFSGVKHVDHHGSPLFVLTSSDSSKSAYLSISSGGADAALAKYQKTGKVPTMAELLALAAKAPTDTFLISDVAHSNEAWAPAPFTTEDRIGFDRNLKASYLSDTVLPSNLTPVAVPSGENQGQTVVRAAGNTHYPIEGGSDRYASYFSDQSGQFSDDGQVKLVALRDLNGNQVIDATERRSEKIPFDGTIVSERDLWSDQ